jgi:ABC-2 type transport system permease protein
MSVATDTELEPRRYGPDAFGDDLRRFVNLTWTLATTDFKLIYFGSILGYVWSLVRPLLFFTVLYLVFSQIFHVGKGIPNYSVQLLIAIIMWTFFLQATGGCVQCLLGREALLRKMRFPRLVIPLAVVLTAVFQLLTNLVPIVVFALASGVSPRVAWLEIPVLLFALALLAAGIGMLLSVLYVRFRDIQPIWDVSSQVLFYASPIIYPVYYYTAGGRNKAAPATFVLHGLGRLLMMNPIASLIAQARHALVIGTEGQNPSAAYALGGWEYIAIPVGIIAFLFVLGVWVFNREAPRIAENL